jgi:hypothetical protein
MQILHEKEIRELHAFFETWYRGTTGNSNRSFHGIETVLAPEFNLITPDGYAIEREQLLALLRTECATKEKRSTLIMAVPRKNPEWPNGMEWIHIHEVCLPTQT